MNGLEVAVLVRANAPVWGNDTPALRSTYKDVLRNTREAGADVVAFSLLGSGPGKRGERTVAEAAFEAGYSLARYGMLGETLVLYVPSGDLLHAVKHGIDAALDAPADAHGGGGGSSGGGSIGSVPTAAAASSQSTIPTSMPGPLRSLVLPATKPIASHRSPATAATAAAAAARGVSWGAKVEGRALELYFEGKSQTEISAALDGVLRVPPRTVRRWFKHFECFGETPSDTQKCWGHMPKSRKSGSSTRFSKRHLVLLKRIIDKRPWLYLDELADEFHRHSNDRFHCSTLWRRLTRDTTEGGLGYSLRVLTEVAAERDAEARAAFLDAATAFTDPAMFLFVDESARDRSASRRRRAWGRRGTACNIEASFTPDSSALYTLIAAADINGFVPEMCDLVFKQPDTDPTCGTVDTVRFHQWVDDFLIPGLGRVENNEARSIVVIDNASIHTHPWFVRAVEAAGAMVLFLPPFSPDFQPIELCFQLYKSVLKRHSYLANADPRFVHDAAIRSVSSTSMRNIMRHVGWIANIPAPLVAGEMHAMVAAVATISAARITRQRTH